MVRSYRVLRLDHVGIAARSAQEATALFEDVLGLENTYEERVEDQGVDTIFFPVGETKLEALVDTGEGGPIGRYIERYGPGIHHLAFEVDDIEAAIAELADAGVRLVDTEPRPGVEGTRIAFLHPKATNGVLIELVEFPG